MKPGKLNVIAMLVLLLMFVLLLLSWNGLEEEAGARAASYFVPAAMMGQWLDLSDTQDSDVQAIFAADQQPMETLLVDFGLQPSPWICTLSAEK